MKYKVEKTDSRIVEKVKNNTYGHRRYHQRKQQEKLQQILQAEFAVKYKGNDSPENSLDCYRPKGKHKGSENSGMETGIRKHPEITAESGKAHGSAGGKGPVGKADKKGIANGKDHQNDYKDDRRQGKNVFKITFNETAFTDHLDLRK
jgi:hypothetical protein